MTEFISAVPIVPARDVKAAASWYRDELGFEVEPPDEYDPRNGAAP